MAMASGGKRRKKATLWCLIEGEGGHGRLRDGQHLLARVRSSSYVARRGRTVDGGRRAARWRWRGACRLSPRNRELKHSCFIRKQPPN
jgi:hypothetical protein